VVSCRTRGHLRISRALQEKVKCGRISIKVNAGKVPSHAEDPFLRGQSHAVSHTMSQKSDTARFSDQADWMISLFDHSRFSIVITQFVRRFRADLPYEYFLRFSFVMISFRDKPAEPVERSEVGARRRRRILFCLFRQSTLNIALPGPYLRGRVPSFVGRQYVNNVR